MKSRKVKIMTASGTTEKANQFDREKVGGALGRIASGVYVVTCSDGSARDGMLATWVNQTSFEPPMVAVAVKKERHILEMLKPGAGFVVNVLAKSNREEYKNFVKPFTEGMDRFEGLNVREDDESAPVLTDTVAYLRLRVIRHLDAGDHVLVLGEVVGGDLMNGGEEPMVHLRKTGFNY